MPSTILAYSFLKTSYTEHIKDPIDAIIPLVKRAIIDLGTKDFNHTIKLMK
jgi:hypothetical protein